MAQDAIEDRVHAAFTASQRPAHVEQRILLLRGEWLLAFGHTLAHVVGALAFAALGFRLASPLLGR